MKAQPLRSIPSGYEPCSPQEATHLLLHLPGPLPNRILPVITGGCRSGTPNWTWNGSVDSPTIKPSVLTKGGVYEGDTYKEYVCHSWINDGKVQFLDDCTHELAGQTIDLLNL